MKVMGWPAFSNKLANPYCSLLYEAMQRKGVEVVEYEGLLCKMRGVDVLHIHWPELALKTRIWLKAFIKCCICLLALLRARIQGARVVWTAHNLQAHEKFHPRLEKLYWWLLLNQVDGVISLSQTAAKQVREKKIETRKIPIGCVAHGHYRDSYPNKVSREVARNRFGIDRETFVVGWVGQIRSYKGLEELVEAWPKFSATEKALLIGGYSTEPTLTALLEERSHADKSIRFQNGRVENEDLQYYFNASDVIVMPYRNILNSGTALLALSFNRPVAIPKSEAMIELQAQVGADWIHLYDQEFSKKTLEEIRQWTQQRKAQALAPLDSLEWDLLAERTLDFFQLVISRQEVIENH